MKTLDYTLTFLTPAFLGDAEQNGRWRTPPFKALIRQWWRVVYAADHGFNVNVADMRREEGLLFGHAWLEDDTVERNGRQERTAARKSLVRLRLERWDAGALNGNQWPGDLSVTHPEVKNRDGKPVPVGSHLYLGYGPLTYDNRRHATVLKNNAAIQANETATLSIAYPTAHTDPVLDRLLKENAPRIQRALWLMHRYGTVGGRSRNGWGSLSLLPLPLGEGWGEGMTPPVRPWRDCLDRDWPHAIGTDDRGPLIWQTAPFNDWKALMKTLAIVKIGLRTLRPFFELTLNRAAEDIEIINKKTGERRGINHGAPQYRHWLAYPVTNHSVKAWGNNARLPNQLRFKVRQTEEGKFVGMIFHVPHLPPGDFLPNAEAIRAVWGEVYAFLDAPAQKLTRILE